MRRANFTNPPRPSNNLCLPDLDGNWRICVQARHIDVDDVQNELNGKYIFIQQGGMDSYCLPDKSRKLRVTLTSDRFMEVLRFASTVHDIEGVDEILVVCRKDGSVGIRFIDR